MRSPEDSLGTLPNQNDGERIRAARKKAGLTQDELATRLCVHMMTISKWERGERKPRGAALLALARELKVGPGWLLGVSDEVGDLANSSEDKKIQLIAAALRRVDKMAQALIAGGSPLSLEARATLTARLLHICEIEGKMPSEVSSDRLLIG